MIIVNLLRWYFRVIGKSPADMEMVSYWKTKESVNAKVTKAKDGSTIMIMEGEKYPLSCYPRTHILFGALSKLKHEIKNQIFNESWKKLEEGENKEEVIKYCKDKLNDFIYPLAEKSKYDMLPPSAMTPAVREIHRAWTVVSPETSKLRDLICFILLEDDAYRFRVQWLAEWFGWFMKLNPVKSFEYSLSMLPHGEVVGDMKERQILLKRILMLALEDESIKEKFIKLFKEINWKKVRLSKADKYYFRGKYFKVDLRLFEY
ncbi:MAG: hypothetical protein WCX88_02115 [Patescibacteria group bacterium]